MSYKKPPMIFVGVLAISLAVGYGLYQNEFRGLVIIQFLLGGFFLAAFSAGLFFVADEAAMELDQKKASVQIAEDSPERDTFAMARLSMAKLDEYYVLNKSQAKWSFFASIFAVTAGFVVLILAIQHSQSTVKVTAGAVAGVLLQFIAGGFFYIYNKSAQQMVLFYTNLTRLQDTMLAVQLCNDLPAGQGQATVMSELIRDVMRRAMRVGTIEDITDSEKPTTTRRVKNAAATGSSV